MNTELELELHSDLAYDLVRDEAEIFFGEEEFQGLRGQFKKMVLKVTIDFDFEVYSIKKPELEELENLEIEFHDTYYKQWEDFECRVRVPVTFNNLTVEKEVIDGIACYCTRARVTGEAESE